MTARYDWSRPRTAQQHIGYVQDGQNPTGLVARLVTHSLIPTTAADQAEHKAKRIIGTILSFPKLGYVSAPYSKKSKPGKEQPSAPKRLLEAATTNEYGEVTSVRVYGFHKANSNYDKGPRDDSCVSTIHVGQTLTFYINEYMWEKSMFPEGTPGVIPPYSVIEVQLNPSHNQSNGYGLKITKITPQGPTFYSYLGKHSSTVQALIRSPEEASASAKELAKSSPSLANVLEQSRYAFLADVNTSACVVDIREDLPFLRIQCPPGSGSTPVPGVFSLDVSLSDLERFTNSPGDVYGARVLVDCAIAAGALKVLVTYDDYYNHKEPALSQYRCAPLVDSEAFLAAVDETRLETTLGTVVFPTPWGLKHEPNLESIAFRVSNVPFSQEEGETPINDVFDVKACVPAPCPDMPIISLVCACARSYKFQVGNPGSGAGGDDFYVASYAFNAAPKAVTGAASAMGGGKPGRTTGFKRVRLEDEDEE